MSSQNGFIVFTATKEMSQQTNRALRAGKTYVAQLATAVAIEGNTSTKTTKRSTAKGTKKKVTKKRSTRGTKKKVTKKASTRKASTKKNKAKAKTNKPKATRRKPVKPEAIIKFVHENDGCNMTDIERATKLPQATIRRVINTARENGAITTTGQRRGLRYHAGASSPAPAMAGADNN